MSVSLPFAIMRGQTPAGKAKSPNESFARPYSHICIAAVRKCNQINNHKSMGNFKKTQHSYHNPEIHKKLSEKSWGEASNPTLEVSDPKLPASTPTLHAADPNPQTLKPANRQRAFCVQASFEQRVRLTAGQAGELAKPATSETVMCVFRCPAEINISKLIVKAKRQTHPQKYRCSCN